MYEHYRAHINILQYLLSLCAVKMSRKVYCIAYLTEASMLTEYMPIFDTAIYSSVSRNRNLKISNIKNKIVF